MPAEASIPRQGGPAALLVGLLPDRLRYADEPRAACVWIADVGEALIALSRGAAQQGHQHHQCRGAQGRSRDLVVCVHLHPGKGGSQYRQQQRNAGHAPCDAAVEGLHGALWQDQSRKLLKLSGTSVMSLRISAIAA